MPGERVQWNGDFQPPAFLGATWRHDSSSIKRTWQFAGHSVVVTLLAYTWLSHRQHREAPDP
jgi:hypothetical protein